MKTVLVATHQISFSEVESLYNCLGVLTLSASLKKRRLHCRVLDLSEFNNLYDKDSRDILKSISQKIIHTRPDILGFSAMINNLPIALDLALRVKQSLPDVHIVFGGPGTAFCASDVLLNFKQVDVIFRGEVDEIFPDYVESFQKNKPDLSLPGLVTRNMENPGKIIDNGWPDPFKNLDELPVPDFPFFSDSVSDPVAAVTPGKFENPDVFGDYNGVSIETGRGCPFTCSFCSTSLYFKRQYRLKSIDRIIDEIKLIHRHLGRARIIFNHDLFTLKRSHVLEFCEKIKTAVPGVVWKCHARLDTLDEEILTKMNDAGCNEIFVGLESATKKMQKIIQKKLDIEKFGLLLDIPNRLNMKFSLSFIVGFPEEDDNDLKEILKYSLEAKYYCREKVQIKIHSLAPLVGSPLYEKSKGKLVYDSYGCLGTTDIPYSWESLHEMIKPHPEIFSLYFHLPIGQRKRSNSAKYAYLGLVIEKLMSQSIYFVYGILGNGLADILVEHLDQVVLPPPASLRNSEYHLLAESVRKLIFHQLENEPEFQKMYDSLARYEIALMESFTSKTADFVRVIESYYHPEELLNVISQIKLNKDSREIPGIEKSPGSKNKRCFMVFRNGSDSRLKSTEITKDYALLFNASIN